MKNIIPFIYFVFSFVLNSYSANQHIKGRIEIVFDFETKGRIDVNVQKIDELSGSPKWQTISSSEIRKNKCTCKYDLQIPEIATLVVYDDDSSYVGEISIKNPYFNRDFYWGNIYLSDSKYVLSVKNLDQKSQTYKAEVAQGSPELSLVFKLQYDHYDGGQLLTDDRGRITNFNEIKNNNNNNYLTLSIYNHKEYYPLDSLKMAFELLAKNQRASHYGIEIKNYINLQQQLAISGIKNKFKFFDMDGKEYTFANFIGNRKYGVIIFGASWCGPCREEIPELKKLYHKYKKKAAFASLSIDTDKEKWKKALKADTVEWLSLAGFPISNTLVSRTFNVTTVPSYVITDSTGKILFSSLNGDINTNGKSRYVQLSDVEEYMDKLLSDQ